MEKSIDAILADELAQRGGFLSGVLSRHLPNNIGEVSNTIEAVPADILGVASEYFRQHGRVLENGDSEVAGLVGGGGINLNPVYVNVQAKVTGSGQTTLSVRAVAKEGLIKQRSGEKAAPLIAEHIVRTVTSIAGS